MTRVVQFGSIPRESLTKCNPSNVDTESMRKSHRTRITAVTSILSLLSLHQFCFTRGGATKAFAGEFVENGSKVRLQKGDTISEVLDRRFPNRSWRIWGKKGVLVRIAGLNPDVASLDRLAEGQVVNIGNLAENLAEFSTEKPIASKAPARVPASEGPEAISPPAGNGRYGWISLQPRFTYSAISATDKATGGHADLPSNLNPGVTLIWGQHWSDAAETQLNLGFTQESYTSNGTGSQISLDNGSRMLTDFGIHANFALTRGALSGTRDEGGFSLQAGVEADRELFARGESATVDTLDAVTIPTLSAGIRYQFPKFDPFTFSVYGTGMYLFSATTTAFSVQSGKGFEMGAKISEDVSEHTDISGGLFYGQRSQDTSLVTQTKKELGLSLGVTFRFDTFTRQKGLK